VVSRAARQQPPVVPASSTRFIVIILSFSYFFSRIFLCVDHSLRLNPHQGRTKNKRSACKWSFLRVSFVFSRIPTTFTQIGKGGKKFTRNADTQRTQRKNIHQVQVGPSSSRWIAELIFYCPSRPARNRHPVRF
jgi:hypothetical protein